MQESTEFYFSVFATYLLFKYILLFKNNDKK